MTFKGRKGIMEHMKREHSMDKFFCIIDGSEAENQCRYKASL